jgi:hypothetical protein
MLKPETVAMMGQNHIGDLNMLGVTNLLARVDVDEDCHCWSLLSLRRPLCISLRSVKRSFDVAVQSAQHPDARVHHEVPAFSSTDQATGRGLPFLKILLGLRQHHDEVGGIAQSQQLAPIQRDRIIEGARPGGGGLQLGDQLSAIRDVQKRSTGVLFRCFDCRTFWADCSAFLSRSRSSFNSEI